LRNSLIASVHGRFGNAGQKSLNQRVHEGEEGLLRQFHAPDLTSQAIETRDNSLLGGFHLAFASGQLSLNRRSNERARVREASGLRRALNAPDQRFVQSDSSASCLGFYRFHTLYGVIIRARDKGVHKCARTASNRARAKLNESKWLTGKQATAAQQPFMFHYPLLWPVLMSLLRHPREDSAKN
jgi:hypothetical protein